MPKREALEKVKELVEEFNRNKDNFLAKDYLENHLEHHFVIPFLKALGWDIESKGIAPFLREVITQDRVQVGKTKKAPDYGFGLPGSEKRLFYLEAKAPSVKIKTDKDAAFQLRRYGRSGQTAVSLLFNFNELAIYDCTQKQNATSDAKFARLKYFTCDEYIANFDFIYDTFSREAIYNGNFHRFIQDKTQKKGSVTLDKDFVESLNKWRLNLAKSIAKNNFKLSEEEINLCVQLLLDRIIFLRFCEERDVEPYGQLQAVANHAHIYKHLFDLFTVADQKYNAGIFDFKKDELTEKLRIEDKVIKSIIEDLYPPKSDYAFSIIPVEILGNAYEQFLGKVIKVSAGHTVKIEEKPEVRKAGGVYYTPQYIVDYIVEHTVGKLIEGKTPKEIEKLKIVDPACGSGSFLLGAYKYLLSYHQKWYYSKNPKSKELSELGTLTTAEKRKILSNNIYGVDLDTNAVEVSKLSLLLKCMEGETLSSVKQQMNLYHTRVLPNIDKNIVNGNSLINHDFFEGEFEFDKAEKKELEHKIKPFDWKTTFADIFKQGGFDVVIGNPPYGATLSSEQLFYITQKYPTTNKFPDSYCVFMIKAKHVLKDEGLFGFIVPNTFCDLENCDDFRKWFLTDLTPSTFYQTGWAFKDAVVDTLVFIAKNKQSGIKDSLQITVDEKTYERSLKEFQENNLNKIDYRNNKESLLILNNLKRFQSLSDFADIKAGVKMYEKGKGTPAQNDKIIKEKPYSKKDSKSKGWLPLYRGSDVNRYVLPNAKEFVNYGPWLAAPRSKELFDGPKILMRRTDDKLRASLDLTNSICVNSCHVIKLNTEGIKDIDIKYLLALLNSKLFQKVFELHNPQMVGKVFSEIKVIYVERLPVKVINFKDKVQKSKHDEIVKHVDSLLKLNEDLQSEKKESAQEKTKQQIAYHENQIDELVYQLYNLSAEEIKIVEGA